MPHLSALLLTAGLFLGVHTASAAPDDLIVDTLADTSVSDGVTSLREAITLANSTDRPGADTIRFADSLTGTINLGSALPELAGELVIVGPGAKLLTVQRPATSILPYRIFKVAVGANVTVSGLTISKGSCFNPANPNDANNYGGGIHNRGTLTVRSCALRDNYAYSGGAICTAFPGALTLESSTIATNYADTNGGGLYCFGAGTNTIRNCTFNRNGASAGGGCYFSPGTNLIQNCTLSSNASNVGGALYISGSKTQIRHCTITRNVCGNSLPFSGGSGIFVFNSDSSSTAIAEVSNSIIAGNMNSSMPGSIPGVLGWDIASPSTGTIASLGYNVIGETSSTTEVFSSTTNDIIDVSNPLLGPLHNNGGPTETHGLNYSSPALDAGDPGVTGGTDQRGEGYPRVQNGRLDVGAVEGVVLYNSLIVTTLIDENDETSDPSFGTGTSLREALLYGRTGTNATVTFAPGLTGTITLNSVLVPLTGKINIEGPGAHLITVHRSSTAPKFQIFRTAYQGTFVISGLTLSNGAFAPISEERDSITYEHGGAISNRGDLTIKDCVVSGNFGRLGGGIFSQGPLTIKNCTIIGNQSVDTYSGGGIYFLGGLLTLENSTISNNLASGGAGGGLSSSGTSVIDNCTFSGNSSSRGGGIYTGDSSQIQNCTITRNTSGNTESTGNGSGLYVRSGNATVTNCIIAGNLESSAPGAVTGTTGEDVAALDLGLLTSNGYNVIGGLGTNAAGVFNATGDVTNITDPKLGPLQNNGGITETHKLLPGSPAINIGGTTDLTNDQRGAGYPRMVNALDAGAYELESLSESLIVTTLIDENDGTSAPAYGTGTSLREAITYANSHSGADTIRFSANLFPSDTASTINLKDALPDLNGELTIEGPGARILAVRCSAMTTAKFSIFNVLATGDVKLAGLTVSHGNPRSSTGGAIVNAGTLSVTACTIRDSSSGRGGGIGNTGRLTLTNSTITGNTAPGYGGGIYSDTSADLTTTYARIENCTISGNFCNASGAVVNRSGLMEIKNSTITLNASNYTPGVHNLLSTARTKISNSIIAGNLVNTVPGPDVVYASPSNTFESKGYNVIGTGNGTTIFTATGDVKSVTDSKLGPLQNNGGPTDTHALLLTSPALNIGGTTNLTTDQRGTGFPRPHAALDAGAYELQELPPVATNFTQLVNRNTPQVLTLTANDPEGNPLTFAIVKQPRYGILSAITGNSVTYTPNTDFSGTDTFTFKASDGENDSNIATATLKVSAPPTLEGLTLSTLDGTINGSGSSVPAEVPLKFSLTVKDEDGADNIRAVYLVFNKTLSNSNGAALAYDPAANRLSLRDAQGKAVAGQAPQSAGTQSNGFVTLDFSQSTVVKDVANKTVTVTWVVTPSASFTGLKGLWAQTRDGFGLLAGFDKMADWTVLPKVIYVSKAQAQDTSTVLKPGVTSLPLVLPVTNPDGLTLTYSIVNGPNLGTLGTLNGNRVVYTPGPNFAATGHDSFTFKANDGYGDSNTATYTIKYNGAPQLGELIVEKVAGPTVDATSYAGEALRLSLTVKDEDGADNIRAVYLVFNKTLSNSNGAALAYDPAANRLSLRDAQGKAVAGQAPQSAGTQSNGFVTLDFSQSTVVKDVANKTVTVTWVVTPSASFTGLKGLWAQTRDGFGLLAGFDKLADWTVLPAPTAFRANPAKPSATTY